MRLAPFFRRSVAAALLVLPAVMAHAQTDVAGGRVVLVLPFDNRSGQANIDWIGESFANTLNARLRSAGFLTISRDDRVYALDHLGLPTGFRPSRASTIRIAQTLDAQFVIVGNYTLKDGTVTAQAQVLEVNQLRMSQPLEQSAGLPRLLDVENNIAWLSARGMDPKFAVAQNTFQAASAGLKLDAYESYIRGITATTDDERLKRLKTAVELSPNNADALLALGKTEFADGNYEGAAAVLAKVPANDPLALEAGFYRGLASFNNAHYAEAEAAFAAVSVKLPLPEVTNNQGVAMARQRKDATALLQRASMADPQDADYHFNIAVALRRRGDNVHAKTEIDQALKRRPNDAEAKQLLGVISGAVPPPPGFDPQERIRRTYSEAAFRQAAFQIDQLRAARLATLPPAQQATEYTQAGQDYLNQGLVLEAEREFQSALSADPQSAAGHLGLATVRERSGNADDARKEAQASLASKPSAAAYLLLARIDFSANQTSAAAMDISNALRLEPSNAAALNMKNSFQSRGITIP
ncbi:tetratricopeptide repeat protein [Terriglobus roseus]|uniref:Tetratricopeptide repeat-containing protein n=1 Tax=Terriglobus roseus TaxID=392734 RepID=A0A1H4QEG2_9BACT|nr:tetratricopeptide repeat protein [Terriglobus roseus]SEC17983.1 Tetratricopeptide repeat-containing protein [Terriglobus roseus]